MPDRGSSLLVIASLSVALAALGQGGVAAAQSSDAAALAALDAAVAANPLKDAYFGETHVHTSYSLDAYIGGARLTPDDAYRFAKGESVMLDGRPHGIVTPLDFAAVTDHAEFLGEMYSTQVEGAPGHDQPELVELRNLTSFEEQEAWFVKYVVSNTRSGEPQHPPFYAGEGTLRSGWQHAIDAARRHYEPGRFTTLAGFEWTAVQQGGNMHRNVLFRDLNLPEVPLTRRRSHFEPLIEMMQIKGNSEVHRAFWAADEFADFENADSIQNYSDRAFQREDFVRWAVIKGFDYQKKLGVNPYQLGFTGGTDNHNGTPSDVVEANYVGSHGAADGTVERRREQDIAGWILGKDSNPGSIAGVWATKNTRSAIWDALRARESFVTSGTQIRPRFFGGAELSPSPSDPVALVKEGYAKGVPMGGTLTAHAGAPTFTIHALKDPDGANLDRIQIIKGWVDGTGEPQEKIFDVAWSDEREPGADGKLPPVGNTVDLTTAAYANTIGSPELIGSWTDRAFDPVEPALYYVRVLEIPTPRWTTYDAVRNGLPLLEDVPATIQERAWTSPIWYTPQG